MVRLIGSPGWRWQARPFRVGDEVHWRWHKDGGSDQWFKARLVEHRPAGYPQGWAGAITDRGTFYSDNYSWQIPLGWVVYLDEPSMTLVTEVGHDADASSLSPEQTSQGS